MVTFAGAFLASMPILLAAARGDTAMRQQEAGGPKTGISEDQVANIEPDEEFTSPNIGGKVRGIDAQGSGAFMAGRTGGGHAGVDLVAQPGEGVLAPIDGTVANVGNYRGMPTVHIQNGRFYAKLLYLKDVNVIVGTPVTKGQVIGLSADMASVYGAGMTNHVHFQIQLNSTKQFIDPTRWIAP